MTAKDLQHAMPGLSLSSAKAYLPYLNQAMIEGKITTKARAAAFLAQLGHESVSLRYFEEIADGSAYEGRLDLGNTQPGDGRRFKGRGPIQLTGRSNYQAAGLALGLNLTGNPSQASTAKVGFRIASWFWSIHGLNTYADRGDFDGLTKVINGSYNGLSDRRDRWAICRSLGDAILPSTPVAYSDKERYLLRLLRQGKRIPRARRVRARAWLLNQQRNIARLARTKGKGGWKRADRSRRFRGIRKRLGIKK